MKKIWMFIFLICVCFSTYSVYAEEISGYETTISTIKRNGVDFYDVTLAGEKCKTVYIEEDEPTSAYYEYSVTGLDPDKVYIVSADFRTDSVVGHAHIGVTRSYSSGSWSYSFSSGLSGTITEWTTQNVVVQPKTDGTAKILIGLGYETSYYTSNSGQVYFKNVKIEDASSNNNIIIAESNNKKIKMILWKEDYDNSNITDSLFNKLLDNLEKMNDYYIDLVGNSSYGKLKSAYSPQIVYNLTNNIDYNIAAMSGYPIEVNNRFAQETLNIAANNEIPYVFLHETAHIYDFALTNDDGSYLTEKDRFSNNHEQTAEFLPLYAVDKMNALTDNGRNITDLEEKYKQIYENTIAQGTYSINGYNYLLSQVKKEGKIDWEAFQKTYKWFNDLSNKDFDKYVKDGNKKLFWFLKKLDDYSETDVRSIYSDNDIKACFGVYKPIESITLENNTEDKTIELTNNYKLNVSVVSPMEADVLVYESSDEDIATIDDFGNVTLKDTNKDSVTITVRSFLNPEVKDSYTYKISHTISNEEETKSDENNDLTSKTKNNSSNLTSNPKTLDQIKIISVLLALSLAAINELIIIKKKIN